MVVMFGLGNNQSQHETPIKGLVTTTPILTRVKRTVVGMVGRGLFPIQANLVLFAVGTLDGVRFMDIVHVRERVLASVTNEVVGWHVTPWGERDRQ
jgi:hypothetical protein